MAAARQADVGAADPQPPVLLRGGDQGGEKLAVGGLDGGALGKRPLRLGDPRGQGVADLLELSEVEHPRRPRGTDPVGNVDPAEALGDEPGELTLEPSDLPPQLGPRPGLVERPVALRHPLGDKSVPAGLRSLVEQIRHEQILSGLEGRCSNP
jgi:hypothetical protein